MRNNAKNGTSIVVMVCAILFLTFTFCYLYFYQADFLAATQHLLSGGKTTYNAAIGATLITIVLLLIQIGVHAVSQLERKSFALTYFPSLLLLTVLTGGHIRTDGSYTFGAWVWLAPLLLIIYIGVVYACRQYQTLEYHAGKPGFLARMLWINLATMAAMFLFVGSFGNSDDVLHYRMKAEKCFLRHDYKGAAAVGKRSLVADSSLTMLRAYALGKQGEIGERLFEYPLSGGSRSLLPDSNTVRLVMLQDNRIYRDLGICLKQKLSPIAYLQFIDRHHVATKLGGDYLLTAYLLDKDLNKFAYTIGKYYKLDDDLPKHYREALTLYTHQHSSPYVEYHNTVMDADFHDYQQLYHSESNTAIRKTKLRDTYGNTYWYYYQYGK